MTRNELESPSAKPSPRRSTASPSTTPPSPSTSASTSKPGSTAATHLTRRTRSTGRFLLDDAATSSRSQRPKSTAPASARFIDALPPERQEELDFKIGLLNRLTSTDPPLPFPHSSQLDGQLREL